MAKLNAYVVTSNLSESQIQNTVVDLLNKAKTKTGVDTFGIVGTTNKKLYMVFCDNMVKGDSKLKSNMISLTPDTIELDSLKTEIAILKNQIASLTNNGPATISTGSDNTVLKSLEARVTALETTVHDEVAALTAKLQQRPTLEEVKNLIKEEIAKLASIESSEPSSGEIINPTQPEEQTGATDDLPAQEQQGLVTGVTYFGIVPSITPTNDDIKSIASEQWGNYVGKELELGTDDDEGYVAIAIPTYLLSGKVPVFINRSNQFTQVPLNTINTTIDGVEYRIDVFDYGYGKVPFKLN